MLLKSSLFFVMRALALPLRISLPLPTMMLPSIMTTFFPTRSSQVGWSGSVSNTTEGWSRTWGEEHFGNGTVHKYGKSTTGESWDIVVNEETFYKVEPHYGWAEVVGDSTQLLSIQPQEKPPGVNPFLDFESSPPPNQRR